METIWIKCKDCLYKEKITTFFIFKHLKNEIIDLMLKSFPSSTIFIVISLLLPNFELRNKLLNIINKKYACPKCGQYHWCTFNSD